MCLLNAAETVHVDFLSFRLRDFSRIFLLTEYGLSLFSA